MKEVIKTPLDISQFWILEHHPVFTLGVNKKNISENFFRLSLISDEKSLKPSPKDTKVTS